MDNPVCPFCELESGNISLIPNRLFYRLFPNVEAAK